MNVLARLLATITLGLTALSAAAQGAPLRLGVGLLTRIAVRPFTGPERRFGLLRQGVHIDAISIPFDPQRWARQFLQQWPEGSDAHASYWQRIIHGPTHDPAAAFTESKD